MHDESASRVPVCPICNQPVWLNEAKTDEEGRAIHEGCYVAKIHLVRSEPVRSEFLRSDTVQSHGDHESAQSCDPRNAQERSQVANTDRAEVSRVAATIEPRTLYVGLHVGLNLGVYIRMRL